MRAGRASAAGIDGQWNAELTDRNQKAATARRQSFTLALKSQDGQVTGFVMSAGKKRTRQQAIQNAAARARESASFRERVKQRLESEDLSLLSFVSHELIDELTGDHEESA